MDILKTIILEALKARGIIVSGEELDAVVTVVNLIVRLTPKQ